MRFANDVLVCDDDAAILDVIALVFEIYDINSRTRVRSSGLIDEIANDCPKMLIVDLWMPEVSGEEIISALKHNEIYNHIFILCISASLDGEEVAMKAGANMFLPKPFDIQSLMSVVNDTMNAA